MSATATAVAAGRFRECVGCGARLSRYAEPHERYCVVCHPTWEKPADVTPAPGLCPAGLHDLATWERFQADDRYAFNERYEARGYAWCRACKTARKKVNGWK